MTSTPSSVPAVLAFEDGIATLTLNRPAALNAIDVNLTHCLRDLGAQVELRRDIRVLIIRGIGPSFCAGGDVQLFSRTNRRNCARTIRSSSSKVLGSSKSNSIMANTSWDKGRWKEVKAQPFQPAPNYSLMLRFVYGWGAGAVRVRLAIDFSALGA